MDAQNSISKLTICVEKPPVRNQKYFVYQGKNYLINFDLLVLNSNYFYKNQEKYKYVDYIPLLTEEENQLQIPEESIESFISICQNQRIQINTSSIFGLQYLSNKYENSELTKITDEIIEEHSSELVIQSFLFKEKIEEKMKKSQNTKKEEEIISKKH